MTYPALSLAAALLLVENPAYLSNSGFSCHSYGGSSRCGGGDSRFSGWEVKRPCGGGSDIPAGEPQKVS